MAKELNLWFPNGASEITLDTVGGSLRAWYYPRIAYVKVAAKDIESRECLIPCRLKYGIGDYLWR